MNAASSGDRTLIVGVLNITPDSFSDGGSYERVEAAVEQATRLREAGADIVDVGGESTRPGAQLIGGEREIRRVLPVLRELEVREIPTSIDTIRAETAQAAVAAGVRWINDVSGGLFDPAMLTAAAWASAEYGARYILGHWRGIPDPDHRRSDYADVVGEVRDALAAQADAAIAAGVAPEHLILDPGLGFDKTGSQCWEILANLDQIQQLGFPVLVGASRKRSIADALESVTPAARSRDAGRGDVHERDLASAVVSALSAEAGAWGVRVHDVAATAQALAVASAWGAHRPPRDRISLTGLEVQAHHGVFEFEREAGQRFVIDVELEVDARAAAAGDDLNSTVHYGTLADEIIAAVAADPVDLIETVAERVAAVALGNAGVFRVTATVHKPDAPIDAEFADVSVTVTRSRGWTPGAAR